jgi:hypothetical protein
VHRKHCRRQKATTQSFYLTRFHKTRTLVPTIHLLRFWEIQPAVMTTHPDYSSCTEAEIRHLQKENHAASRVLINRVKGLVNRRLAHEMSFDEFTASKAHATKLIAVLHSRHEALRTALHRVVSSYGRVSTESTKSTSLTSYHTESL